MARHGRNDGRTERGPGRGGTWANRQEGIGCRSCKPGVRFRAGNSSGERGQGAGGGRGSPGGTAARTACRRFHGAAARPAGGSSVACPYRGSCLRPRPRKHSEPDLVRCVSSSGTAPDLHHPSACRGWNGGSARSPQPSRATGAGPRGEGLSCADSRRKTLMRHRPRDALGRAEDRSRGAPLIPNDFEAARPGASAWRDRAAMGPPASTPPLPLACATSVKISPGRHPRCGSA
jgi:hypothetical protein